MITDKMISAGVAEMNRLDVFGCSDREIVTEVWRAMNAALSEEVDELWRDITATWSDRYEASA